MRKQFSSYVYRWALLPSPMSDSSSCSVPATGCFMACWQVQLCSPPFLYLPCPSLAHRELPQLLESLGTADKGEYQELHPLPRKAGWVIATGSRPSSTPGISKPSTASLLGKCYSSCRHHCAFLHKHLPCYLGRNLTEHILKLSCRVD